MCFGFAKNWRVLLGLRLVLGVLEGGFFPGEKYLRSDNQSLTKVISLSLSHFDLV